MVAGVACEITRNTSLFNYTLNRRQSKKFLKNFLILRNDNEKRAVDIIYPYVKAKSAVIYQAHLY